MMKRLVTTLMLFVSLPLSTASAWTLRGHSIVCEAAIFLVQDPDLREYLQGKGAMMSHLCNIPDTQWKETKGLSLGSASHYFAADLFNSDIRQVDLDFSRLVQDFLNKNAQYQVGLGFYQTIGSNWWRADQFFRLAVRAKKDFALLQPPMGDENAKDDQHPYNRAIFDFIVHLGLMGHFVGDNAQPFHVTQDIDGYQTGHGGIHLFYEHELVNFMPETLFNRVIGEGRELQRHSLATSKDWLKEGNVLERMRTLAALSWAEKDLILKLDFLFKESPIRKESTQVLNLPATRLDARSSALKYEDLVAKEMGRGAALLAQFWVEAYHEIGRPRLSGVRTYRYPTLVEFVPPDYYPDLK